MSSPNVGRITQVIGSTLDAQFSEDSMPALYNALSVQVERTVLGEKMRETLWCEVAQHLGGGQVRAVSLGSTDGLQRGQEITDSGSAVTVPVGLETLGRVFNLVGEPLADRGCPADGNLQLLLGRSHLSAAGGLGRLARCPSRPDEAALAGGRGGQRSA